MRLLLLHPKWAARTCKSCMTHIYGLEDGELRRWPDGTPKRRPLNTVLPCGGCPKIPKGAEPSPRNAQELNDRLWLAYQHYRRCRAVNRWPEDPIIERNAEIIREVEDDVAKQQENEMLALLLTRK